MALSETDREGFFRVALSVTDWEGFFRVALRTKYETTDIA